MTFRCQIRRLGQGHALRDRGYSYFIFKYPIPFSKAIPLTGIEPGTVRATHTYKKNGINKMAPFLLLLMEQCAEAIARVEKMKY